VAYHTVLALLAPTNRSEAQAWLGERLGMYDGMVLLLSDDQGMEHAVMQGKSGWTADGGEGVGKEGSARHGQRGKPKKLKKLAKQT
jgi:hypothetical protein